MKATSFLDTLQLPALLSIGDVQDSGQTVPSSHTIDHLATLVLSGGEYTYRSGQQDGALYPHEDQQAYREHTSHRNRN